MRELDFDKLLMCSYNLVLMRLTKRELGRRMVNELSESSGWRFG